MDTKELTLVSDSPETNQLAAIRTRIDFCKEHYHPCLREDFNMHHLSLFTNFLGPDIEIFFSQSPQPFNQYLDEWRVKYAKNLMN